MLPTIVSKHSDISCHKYNKGTMGKIQFVRCRPPVYDTIVTNRKPVRLFLFCKTPSKKVTTSSPWSYVLNLAGSELPVYSVDELSERLSEVHDMKISTDSYYSRKFQRRWKFIEGKK